MREKQNESQKNKIKTRKQNKCKKNEINFRKTKYMLEKRCMRKKRNKKKQYELGNWKEKRKRKRGKQNDNEKSNKWEIWNVSEKKEVKVRQTIKGEAVLVPINETKS